MAKKCATRRACGAGAAKKTAKKGGKKTKKAKKR